MRPAAPLETPRLLLRPIAEPDVPELTALLADPGVYRFLLDGRGIAEVLAGADAPNAASLRLVARLGFEPLRETPGAFGVIRWFVRRGGAR